MACYDFLMATFADGEQAVKVCDTPGLAAWLISGGDPNGCDDQGRSLLMLATSRAHECGLDLLIRHRASVDYQQRQGTTVLSFASLSGSVSMVRRLLEASASPDLVDARGSNPLDYAQLAASRSDGARAARLREVVALLLQHKLRGDETPAPSGTPLPAGVLEATHNGDIAAISSYLSFGGAVDAKDSSLGGTMLMCAASSGHAMLVNRLISANASVNVSDNNGCASLHIACFAAATAWASMRDPSCMREPVVRMDESCMQTLLDHKAVLEQQDHAGLTPLMIASQADCAPVVNFLLRAGASLDTLDINGHSALWHADAQGHRALAKLLRRKQMSAPPPTSTDQRIAAAVAAAEAAAESLLAEMERERETAAHRVQRRRERKAARPKKAGGSSMGSSMGSNGSSTEAGDLSSLDFSSIEGSLVGSPERRCSKASTSCEGLFRHASHCCSTCGSSSGADTSCEGSFRQCSHCGSTCESSTCGSGGWDWHSLDVMTSAIDHNTISHECALASLAISSASTSATTTNPPACAPESAPLSVVHMAVAVGSANSEPSERRTVDLDPRAEWRLPPPPSQPPPSIIIPESPAAAHANAPVAVHSASNGIARGDPGKQQLTRWTPAAQEVQPRTGPTGRCRRVYGRPHSGARGV